MYIGLHVKYPLFLSDVNETIIISAGFGKNTQIINLMKIHPVGAEMSHVERRTDITKLTVAFRNFASAPNSSLLHYKLKLPVQPYKVSSISFLFLVFNVSKKYPMKF
jgi:hypothetical protein